MSQIEGLVTFVVPAYNAAAYIVETLDSIQSQTWPNWEIIVVDDGSSDNTAAVVESRGIAKAQVIHQSNSGVSSARNSGFAKARGEFVVFLDADDLLRPHFLEERVRMLMDQPEIGFVGGVIESFPVSRPLIQAVADDPRSQILFFTPGFGTIPSNYVFRSSILRENGMGFLPSLNSTADRFFLLQLAQYTKGAVVKESVPGLLYRVRPESMSHQITPKLMIDNEQFYHEVVSHRLIPNHLSKPFKSTYFYSLALGYAKVGQWKKAISFGFASFVNTPFRVLSMLWHRANGKTFVAPEAIQVR